MAGRFPPEWLDMLRERADIVSVVSEYVTLKQNGRRYWGLCPFHNEKTASFSVDSDRQMYYCFGCKAGGNAIQFVMETERLEFAEAVRHLADRLHMSLPEQVESADYARTRSLKEDILALNRKAAHIYHAALWEPDGKPMLDYLYKRGLDDAALVKFGIGATPPGWDGLTKKLMAEGHSVESLVQAGLTTAKNGKTYDMFRQRAMFPIINAHGAVLGFGGRAMGDAQPKYLNTADTPAFNKRMGLYAINLLRKVRGLSRIILVEGYMDVVSLVQKGVVGVVATLGTALTPEQAKLLARYAPEVWVAYDGDSAGQAAILKALDILTEQQIPARVLKFPDGLDPDDFVRERGLAAFEALMPLDAALYRMQTIAAKHDLSTQAGRTQYAIACAPVLATVREPVELENLLQQLMLETGFSREVLLQQIGRTDAAPAPAKARNTPLARRDMLSVGQTFMPDHVKAERQLLSLMTAGRVPYDTAVPEDFSEPLHQDIISALLSGMSPSALTEEYEDADRRAVVVEILQSEPQFSEDQLMRMVADYRERMRLGQIDARITYIRERLPAAQAAEKKEMCDELLILTQERARLKSGRKE